jgi:cobalt/nickel transport system ATP-binding protein
MLCIIGFLELEQGEILVKDLTVGKKTLKQVRRQVGMIFQNADDQLFMPTLYEDVAFGLLNKGIQGDDLSQTVKKALADRGLSGLEEKFPGHLSGGQKRLASLAGVLVMEPEILLLDEPSSNLDPKSRRQLIEQLDDLDNARVLASHDLEMVLDLCTRVLVLDRGRLVAEGDPAEILADERMMESCRLEVPHSLLPHRYQHHQPRSRK